MAKELKFYKCPHCGNLIELIAEGGGKIVCCGEPIKALHANTTDAAQEKHVPVITKEGNEVTVKVGSVAHPMLEEHYITFIVVVVGDKVYRSELKPGEAPEFVVTVDSDETVVAYEYCNLHGLWKATL